MTRGGPGQDPGDVYLGLDLGTSGLKAVVLGASGTILARAGAAYPTHRPVAGAYEQEAGDWLQAVEQVVARLGEAVPARRWRAIGLSGMLPTLVTLGPHEHWSLLLQPQSADPRKDGSRRERQASS
jgi:sugar (pentulose or hexulose) kinase